ncbi:exodeoxyribonuclease VII small subunit [Mollicutes bacterium LVI A0078]|nr:exodeoxyribonuclease VII small subunit [Mollicutes bacterium LVI A0075]WOO91089.1 exodeoxyribonuclease VII small subunit [Mollicutes bacterium LVI A0078]
MNNTFEEAYTKLQATIADLQDENKTLDESIENFKLAVELHKTCQQKLDEAKEQIVEIIGDDNA